MNKHPPSHHTRTQLCSVHTHTHNFIEGKVNVKLSSCNCHAVWNISLTKWDWEKKPTLVSEDNYQDRNFSKSMHIHFCLQSRQQVLQPYLPRDRAMVRIQMEYRWRSCSSMKSWSLTSGLWTTAIWTGWADCSILPTSCTRRSSLQRRDNSCNTTSSALLLHISNVKTQPR